MIVDCNAVMADTDNMTTSFDAKPSTYDFFTSSTSPQRLQPSSSYSALSDSACNIGSISQEDHRAYPRDGRGYAFEQDSCECVYPSPPSTASQLKRSVPLPCVIRQPPASSSSRRSVGGVLDSPLIMTREAHLPLSPPATLPTSTLALPDADCDCSSDHDDDDEKSLSFLEQCYDLDDSDASDAHHLLSPLSPEWGSNGISDTSPALPDSVLLSKPTRVEAQAAVSLSPSRSSQTGHSHSLTHADNEALLLNGDNPPLMEWWEFANDVPTFSPLDFYSDGFGHASTSRPFLHLEIPDLLHPPANERHSWVDEDDDRMVIEEDRNLFDYDSDILVDDRNEHTPTSTYPGSPFIPTLPLLDVNLPPQSPSSPSLRSFTSLPDFDMEDDFCPPPSPRSPPLVNLPGVDADDDLIEASLADNNFETPTPMASPPGGRSLLLLDDPTDFPPPRSPSPENFDIDMSLIDESADPDLQKLCDLRKRSQAAERSLKQVEMHWLEVGAVHLRAETRKERKKEKERSREVSALLRLKLGDRIIGSPKTKTDYGESGKSSSKKMITSIAQLVARMMFRRCDTSRPLANRKPASPSQKYTHSPLSRSIVVNFDGEEIFNEEPSILSSKTKWTEMY